VEKLKKLFVKLDDDANGVLTMDELRNGLKKVLKGKISKEKLEQMVAEADQDGDGSIDYEEFVAMMESKAPQKRIGDAALGETLIENQMASLKRRVKGELATLGQEVKQRVKKAIYSVRGGKVKEKSNLPTDPEWPKWKQEILVDPGQSVKKLIAELPELVKAREPFDIFRAKVHLPRLRPSFIYE
jgi:hypothetical protein